MSETSFFDNIKNFGDTTSDSTFGSNVLIISAKEVLNSDLLDRLLKEGVNECVTPSSEQSDFESHLLKLTLKSSESENVTTAALNISATSKRVNHSTALKETYKNANNVMFVFNASSRASFDELTGLMNDYIVLSQRQDSALLLVGCKNDDKARGVDLEEILTWASVSRTKRSIAYIECCASTGHGIADITAFLMKQAQSLHRKAISAAAAQEAALLIDSSACGVADVDVKNASFFLKAASSKSFQSNMADEDEGPEEDNRWKEFEVTMANSLSLDKRESRGSRSLDEDDDEAQLLPELVKSSSNVSETSSVCTDKSSPRSSRSSSHSKEGKSSPRHNRDGIFAGQLEQAQRNSYTSEDLQQVRNLIEQSYGYEEDQAADESYRYPISPLPGDGGDVDKRNGRGKLSRQHTGTTEVSVGDLHGDVESEAASLTQQQRGQGRGAEEKDCSDALWCFVCF